MKNSQSISTSTSKAKVLFAMHLPPPLHGASLMSKRIMDSVPVNQCFDCRFVNIATAADLEDIGRFRLKKITGALALRKRLKKIIREFKPDVIYFTPCSCGVPFYKDFIISSPLRHAGVPVLYHYHNKGVATHQHRPVDNLLYKRFFKKSKVILLSPALYNDVSKYVGADDVMYCPNGIEGVADMTSLRGHSSHDGPTRILFLSNLFKTKGILTVLDSARILNERGEDFKLIIAGGETEDFDSLKINEAISGRGLEGKVRYAGAVYGEEKERTWREADIFVFPTEYECFPVVNLEAMCHGLPIVSTREGGIPNMITTGHNGFLIEKGDARQCADALQCLIRDPELRLRMGRRNIDIFNQRYTLPEFESNIVKAIKQCI